MGFRLNLLKWSGLSVQSPLSPSTSSWPCSYSYKSKDASYCVARSSAATVLYEETETLNDTSRAHICSTSPQILESNYLGTSEMKVTTESEFRLLMKNLDVLEDKFADSNVVRLERDILEQLQRLGALRLFHSCLSRTIKSSSYFNFCHAPIQFVEEHLVNDAVDNHVSKVVVLSGKKELRKLRRKKTLDKETVTSWRKLASKAISRDLQLRKLPSRRRASRNKNNRQKIARNEAEMSSGVKLVAELEKLKMTLEKESGQIASLSSWAKAVGIEKKELQQHLHYGWHCRDELLRSTRSLVLFIARNYWGLGVAFEDLIQAGNLGVLQGAERFDQSRGCKFSTYVQYWIRKSMSTFVAKHARGIRVPCTLSKVINKVQKARKALSTNHGKYPNDCEIAKFTGLLIAKITSASKCLRVVGSIDQKIGEGTSAKFMEITPDTSIMTPEESVVRQHMIKDVHTLLNGLETREMQVLILRYGLGNRQRKSLEEIGRIIGVSKEWIRKIERAAMDKLRNEDSLKFFSHYDV